MYKKFEALSVGDEFDATNQSPVYWTDQNNGYRKISENEAQEIRTGLPKLIHLIFPFLEEKYKFPADCLICPK